MPRKDTKTCCICGKKFKGEGHNPDPVKPFDAGRCCDYCNVVYVNMARIYLYLGRNQ